MKEEAQGKAREMAVRRNPAPGNGERPRLLDLFCGAGGCTKGYQRAGFYVVGVDIKPQPNYCGDEFYQGDALHWLEVIANPLSTRFAAIHASPPCQFGSKAQRIRGNDHPNLIPRGRELLQQAGLPYVIENVPDARSHLIDPITLCGTMFGLPLYRHRLFECSFPVAEPLHGQHYLKQVKMGRAPRPGEIVQPVGNFSGAEEARSAMGTPWMTRDEMAEAIPPAYTKFVGTYLMAEIRERQKAAA